MILIVSNDSGVEDSLDTISMPASDFNQLATHPYIATAGFEYIYLDLRCNLNELYVQQLVKACCVIPMYKDFELSPNAINILSYIYREQAAALRFYSVKDKEKFKELLQKLCDAYKWRKIECQDV